MGHETTQVGPGGGPGDLEGFWGRVIGSGGGHPGPTRPGQGVGFGVGASSELQPVLGALGGCSGIVGPAGGRVGVAVEHPGHLLGSDVS